MAQPQRAYLSDCEGPISKNDNAFELSSKIIPGGNNLFKVISKYGVVQADVVRRPNRNAGDTLKLILPFFKAFGATDELMEQYSSENIALVPRADHTLKEISMKAPTHIISTSYEHYIRSLCDAINFPFKNTYSTRLKINNYSIKNSEKDRIRKIAEEVVTMPVMKIPESNSMADFSEEDRGNVKKLDEIFWKEFPKMSIGRILEEVKPVGGQQKANAVDDIVRRLNMNKSGVMYVGDSITDVTAFREIRNAGGLTVSFNGNNYAVREAEMGVISQDTDILSEIAAHFLARGREGAIAFAKYHPRVEVITDENRKEFSEHSSRFRQGARGKAIGKLS